MICHLDHGLEEVDTTVWREGLPSDGFAVSQDILVDILA